MGLVLIGGGIAAAAVITAVLFLPQTASLFPQPGQLLDSFQADAGDVERQAAAAAADAVDGVAEAAAARAGIASAAPPPAAGIASAAPPPAAGAPAAAAPPPAVHQNAGPNGAASATAKAAAAESAIGPLVSLPSQGGRAMAEGAPCAGS